VRHNHHFVSSQKLLDAQGCVGGGIVVVQELIPTLPLSWTLLLQAFTQSFQHLQVKLLIYCLCWRNKLPMHYPVSIVLTLEQTCSAFFWSGRIWCFPLTLTQPSERFQDFGQFGLWKGGHNAVGLQQTFSLNHLYTSMASFLKASLSIRTVSAAVLPRRKQNFTHTLSLRSAISIFKKLPDTLANN
jgi:hypothetical protein